MRTTYFWHVGQQSTIPAIPSYSNTTAMINLGSAGYLPSCTTHPKVQHCEEWLLLRINLPLDCFSVTTAPNFVWVLEVGDQNGQHFLSLRDHVFRSGRTPHHFSPMCM